MSMLKELRRHPSAVAGLVILVIFVGFSIYTVFAFPYSEAIKLWRAGPGVWDELPRRAAPVWYDYFTRKKLPRTIIVSLEDGGTMTAEPAGDGKNRVEIVFPFEYAYDGFPKEISLFVEANIAARGESYSVYMRKPNGETVTLTEDINFIQSQAYRISQEGGLRMKLGGLAPHVGLFVEDPHRKPDQPLKGRYELVMRGDLSEEAELSVAKLVVYGQVHGLAGTDHLRRDLTVALSWGAPIALMFGVLAAVGTQISTFILGGIGTWFGGRLDAIFQRVTEVFMILPLLAVLIMIGHFYSRSIWVMLGMVILLNVFSSPLKVYRAMFLQAKEAPYIEAARAYGAGNFRIIFRYLLPRLTPVLLPNMVIVIPTFVFLEASLAVLGLGDPVLPTWGKIIFDARTNDALYMGNYYWMIQPAVLLMVIGFSFALVGYTLDRILNPRLRKL
ncbi:MAG TPA: ABC transporter permease [Bacillota bacterium]|jgi:peptide/nickel transport system permease protein|nr:ABC transporter permease [Bacillota bacterium]HOA35614.1 ABC transporter permease [Bacillota bacterium]HOJ83965.1 ABC transporter permease [Bacillota bacterium]HOL16004.1 ABC transporter permease [Bacillota bacterium]HPZ11446.1 ABC transporter permease [Bacillota bacterium]